MPLDGDAGLGHLHQRQTSLLHPSATGGRDDEQRERVVHGTFDGEGNHFPYRRPETPAQKTEIHDSCDEGVATDAGRAAQHRLGK